MVVDLDLRVKLAAAAAASACKMREEEDRSKEMRDEGRSGWRSYGVGSKLRDEKGRSV